MKIGPKIALFYSLITMCAIIMVMSVFYLFSSRYINRLYESYLREKAFITAQKYWEKDEVDEQSYRLIQQKYDELLPQAREVLLNMCPAMAIAAPTVAPSVKQPSVDRSHTPSIE